MSVPKYGFFFAVHRKKYCYTSSNKDENKYKTHHAYCCCIYTIEPTNNEKMMDLACIQCTVLLQQRSRGCMLCTSLQESQVFSFFLGYIRYVPGIMVAQEAHHFRHFRLARAEASSATSVNNSFIF